MMLFFIIRFGEIKIFWGTGLFKGKFENTRRCACVHTHTRTQTANRSIARQMGKAEGRGGNSVEQSVSSNGRMIVFGLLKL